MSNNAQGKPFKVNTSVSVADVAEQAAANPGTLYIPHDGNGKLYFNDAKLNTLNDDQISSVNALSNYSPNASDDATVDVQKVTASQLKGKPIDEVLDILLFPEYDAQSGSLPAYSISNSDAILEVGESIPNAGHSPSAGSPCRYVKNDNGGYVVYNYSSTAPTVKTTITNNNTKAIFGSLTRSTGATSYTVTGPNASQLSNGYLYKSKGTVSTVKPLATGTVSIDLAGTSKTVTGVYKGGKNGSKSDSLWVNPSGQLSSSKTGTYGTSLTYDIHKGNSGDAEKSFAEVVGTKSVQLYVPSGVTYAVKLTAKKYNPATKEFENDKDLTVVLDDLTVTEGNTTFQDANGASYNVKSYSFDTKEITTLGKFAVQMSIKKN